MRWPVVPLDSIKADTRYSLVGGPFGSNLTTRDYVEEGVPVIRGNNLPDNASFADDGFVFVSEAKADVLLPNNAYPGDVVFTQRGTLGQVGVIPQESRFPRYIISQSQMKLTVHPEKADARFVYYYFRHPNTVQIVKNHALSSGVPHINLEILKGFEIPLPPFPIQHRIVSVLSTYDSLIENNLRRMGLLEESARLLYREWFVRLRFPGYEHTRIVNGVPEGWERSKIGEIGEVVTGKTPSKSITENFGGGIPFVKTPDMHGNVFVIQTGESLSETGAKSQQNKFLPPNTLLVSCIGTVGVVALSSCTCQTNQQINSVIPHNQQLAFYCYFAFKDLREHLEALSGGATMANVNKTKFEGLEINVPSHSLIVNFSEIAEPLFSQIKTLQMQNQKFKAARDLLLPRLMSGEIAV